VATLEERLTELETRLAFVDDTVGSLSDLVAVHDRQMHELRSTLDRMRIELSALRGTLGHDARDEPPPPHY
jgi:SlyX protein